MSEDVEAAKRADEAFNAHDLEARLAVNTADTELVMPGGMSLRGPEQLGEILKVFWEAMPDAQVTHQSQVTVVTEGYLTGTHTGTFRTPQGDLPPTGNQVNLRYAAVRQIEGGKIASEHLYWDQMEFLQQLGAIPGPSGT